MSQLAESRRDTIVAVATALGEAAVAVVRLSGPEALAIAGRLLADGSVLPPSHRAAVRRLWHSGRQIDEALVICFQGPRSFTGEDVVELQCHGGLMTVRLLVDSCLACGARVAEPGELTRRAMLNGRLDLLQVEAIADVIAARSEAGHALAQAHLAGRLSEAVGRLSEARDDAETATARVTETRARWGANGASAWARSRPPATRYPRRRCRRRR